MGIIGSSQPASKNNTGKITELQRKIQQLRASGMVLSAERMEKQLRQYKVEAPVKIKPMNPAQLKREIQGAKAVGMAK